MFDARFVKGVDVSNQPNAPSSSTGGEKLKIGRCWADVRHYPDGSMRVGVECEHPPRDKHYLLMIEGDYDEETMEIANAVAEALNKSESPAPASSPSALEDFDWALERVNRMCAGALIDAQVYGKKQLKGFGYPNETFGRAQDHRALLIVLTALAAAESRQRELEVTQLSLSSGFTHARQRAEELEALSAQQAERIKALIEAGQRERDRAQAIIHHVLAGGRVGWSMLLKDGAPDVEAIAAIPKQALTRKD